MAKRISHSYFTQLVSLLFFIIININLARAQTTSFTYQGRLNDAGNPATGVYDLQFRLFDALSNGNQVGSTLTRDDVTVTSGSFSVTLDFGASAFPGANRWLEIGVRPGASTGAFTTLNPRQPINSTPYSIKSANAAAADGLSAACTGCVSSTQIGSLPTNSTSYIQNTNTQQASSNFNISGNGVIGGTLGIGTGTAVTDGVIHAKGQNPVRILGETTTLIADEIVDFFARSTFFNSELGGMRIQRQPATGNIDTMFFAAAAGNPASEKMRITGTGNVGIGTSTPFFQLDIVSSAPAISLTDTNSGKAGLLIYGSNGFQFNPSGLLGGVGMVIQSGTNNVGIGTVTPQARLDIAGTTRTAVVQITGGADFSENFDVNVTATSSQAAAKQVEAGMVVSIDAASPGKLRLSTRAYDRRVAGVISGAGAVKPGLVMGQQGSVADGNQPVAISGRVYCWVDTAYGAIRPGDLLTTSPVPGHAMKATNHAKAQGAILGKAMTELKSGRGLVLILVTLQ
ncbi:MAG: hypothetical protein JST85_28545 [Acidobacteria bacterium]|nr:hypothetical protein [Acidobacteriota bacterium]